MNVDLQGESGAAFAAKAFWRTPLARLAAHIAPEIADECPTRMLNSSAGLERCRHTWGIPWPLASPATAAT